jgi:hypothetical protein
VKAVLRSCRPSHQDRLKFSTMKSVRLRHRSAPAPPATSAAPSEAATSEAISTHADTVSATPHGRHGARPASVHSRAFAAGGQVARGRLAACLDRAACPAVLRAVRAFWAPFARSAADFAPCACLPCPAAADLANRSCQQRGIEPVDARTAIQIAGASFRQRR